MKRRTTAFLMVFVMIISHLQGYGFTVAADEIPANLTDQGEVNSEDYLTEGTGEDSSEDSSPENNGVEDPDVEPAEEPLEMEDLTIQEDPEEDILPSEDDEIIEDIDDGEEDNLEASGLLRGAEDDRNVGDGFQISLLGETTLYNEGTREYQ